MIFRLNTLEFIVIQNFMQKESPFKWSFKKTIATFETSILEVVNIQSFIEKYWTLNLGPKCFTFEDFRMKFGHVIFQNSNFQFVEMQSFMQKRKSFIRAWVHFINYAKQDWIRLSLSLNFCSRTWPNPNCSLDNNFVSTELWILKVSRSAGLINLSNALENME